MIEKKRDTIIKQSKELQNEPIKTVRGKIKLDKELFPGCYTKFFEEDIYSDEDHIEQFDANQVYSLHLKNLPVMGRQYEKLE